MKRIIFLLLLICIKAQAVQSWGVVQPAASAWLNQAAVVANFGVPTTAGNMIIIFDGIQDGTATSSCTDAQGQTITLVPVITNPIRTATPFATEYVWYIQNITGGVDSITCTTSATVRHMVHIFEIAGAATASPIDAANSTVTSGSAALSIPVTTTGTNELIFFNWVRDGNNCDTWKPGATQTAIQDMCVAGNSYFVQAGIGTATMTGTLSPNTANAAQIVLAIKPGTGAAPAQLLTQMNWQNATNFVLTHPPSGGGSACTIANSGGACLAVHFPNPMLANHSVFIWAENNIPGMTLASISDNNSGIVQSIPGNPFINGSNSLNDFFYVISSTNPINDYIITIQYTCGGVSANCTTGYVQIFDFSYNVAPRAANDGTPTEVGAIGCTGPCTMATNNIVTAYPNDLLIAVHDAAGCNTNCAALQFNSVAGVLGWQLGKTPCNSCIDWGGGFVSGADTIVYTTVTSTGTYNQTTTSSLTTGYDAFIFALKQIGAPLPGGIMLSGVGY